MRLGAHGPACPSTIGFPVTFTVRPYTPADEPGWLRCRALAFLSTPTLDAWTRGDAAANSWYRRSGFRENFRYLHVYKQGDESAEGLTSPDGLSAPVTAFMHADFSRHDEMRAQFARVHVCRQYLRHL